MHRLIFISCVCGAVYAAPIKDKDSLVFQEIRADISQIEYQLKGNKVEIDLFQERLDKLEKLIDAQKQYDSQDTSYERRFLKLEKTQESLIADCKQIKDNLSSCQKTLSKIDSQIASDIQNLKKSLESMLACMKQESSPNIEAGKEYVVKTGDSLGKIAAQNKVSVNTIKRINQLSSDSIYAGQKLKLP